MLRFPHVEPAGALEARASLDLTASARTPSTSRQHETITAVTLVNGLRTRRYAITFSGVGPTWLGIVSVDGHRHRTDRVEGADAGDRLLAEYEEEIAGRLAEGWTLQEHHA